MFRSGLVLLAVTACAVARPQQRLTPVAFPVPQSSGQSTSGVVKGETFVPGGSSVLTQQQAGTGGQAANGGFNQGSAGASTTGFSNPFAQGSNSQTSAVSNQGSNPVLTGFPFPSFPGFGTATGNAGSQLTQGKTTGPDGSQTTITQLGSSAGGSATDGGVSTNQASGSVTDVNTPFGSQTSSNVNAESNQSTGR
ncbi:secreted protein C-like [Amphibalanus amphitrite]|uniref:secreted protein C-like n=1 Tax=Amphibalanus amphitrite TaxID=1232801 RepID=UPI001C903CDA|nr:secreted protein C-like [Amphibalanus amphitrite]